MLERAVARGPRAGARALIGATAPTSPTASPRSPRSRPVCAATITTGVGPGRAPHPEHELVPPRGAALRRVRLELLAPAPRFGSLRSLTDTVYNMNRAHLAPETPTFFECARRRRRAHGRHDLPDLPRPPPPRASRTRRRSRGSRRRRCFRAPGLGPARAVLRRPLRLARTGCRGQLGMPGPARPPHRLRRRLPRRARPVRLPAASRCPTTTPTRTATARTRRSPRSPPPTASSSG